MFFASGGVNAVVIRGEKHDGRYWQKKLGQDKYSHATYLVSEIKIKKLSLLAENCPKCRLANPDMDSTSSFSESLPIPVRNLFFNTPLPEIFEKYSLERVQNYGPYYLNELIQQAETHLQEYVAWKTATSY